MVEVVCSGCSAKFGGNTLEMDYGDRKETFISSADIGVDEERTFIEAVKKSDPKIPKSSYEDAVKTLEVTLACYRSWTEKRIIEI
jgi:predicted dehydrogenase